MADLTIRQVTAEDYEEVVNIRDVYEGRDYLPGLFHEIIKRHDGFAAFVGEKMVAFRFIYTLDGGTTMHAKAGRVHKDYEGIGIYKKLDEYTTEFYANKPSVLYKAISFSNANQRLMKYLENGQYRMTFHKRLEAYRQLLKSLSTKVENKPPSPTTKSVCLEEFSNLLKNSEMTSRLFPHGHFSSMWTPLRIQPENSKHVFADSGAVFGSDTSDPSKTMLSIGHPVINAVGVMYVIDMYGLRHDHVTDHIVSHLQTVLRYEEEIIQLEIFLDEQDIEFTREIVTGLGFERIAVEENELFCIEKSLK